MAVNPFTGALRSFCHSTGMLVAIVAFSSTARGGGQPQVLYVDDDASSGELGESWDTAFASLQVALDWGGSLIGAGLGPVEIRVAQGTYIPQRRTDPTDPRSVTFKLIEGVSLVGGFAGPGTPNPDALDPEQFETTLSGFLAGGERAYHVMLAEAITTETVVSGFTATGGSADVGSTWPAPNGFGGALLAINGCATIESCRFVQNFARTGGCIYSRDTPLLKLINCRFEQNSTSGQAACVRGFGPGVLNVEHCMFRDNSSQGNGCAIAAQFTTVFASDSEFVSNVSDHGVAVFNVSDAAGPTVVNCRFVDNSSEAGAGALVGGNEPMVLDRCQFVRNHCELGSGAALVTGTVRDCLFIDNEGWIGGGLIADYGCTIINSIFSGNSADKGGGILAVGPVEIINCTIAGSTGSGVSWANVGSPEGLTVTNSILWNNVPDQIALFDSPPPPPSDTSDFGNVTYSCIQGGWTGFGNIDVNPMLSQPGCDNVRLTFGSPCINAGSNAALPPSITTDLDGQPRIQGGTVDMGAYEGGHDPLPAMACEDDLDEGEEIRLIPSGGAYSPTQNAAIYFYNNSVNNNSIVNVTESDTNPHPGADGFNMLASSMDVQTSLADGELFMRVTIPFDQSTLNGFAIEDMNVTHFDAATGEWKLAAMANTVNSPGHPGPLGDRIVVLTGGSPGHTGEVGDHGVFWNPTLQRGYVWANVDHADAADFASGIALPMCLGDTDYPPDNAVNTVDLQRVLTQWGVPTAGPNTFADVDRNGVVNTKDLLTVIDGWGRCK